VGVFSGVCLSFCQIVCQFVCQHDNFRTIKRIGRWNLAVRCVVRKSRPSSNSGVKGQRSRSPGTKNEKVRHFVRKRSSGRRYAGGKISAHAVSSIFSPSIDFSTSMNRFSRNFATECCKFRKWLCHTDGGVHMCPLKISGAKTLIFASLRTQSRHFEPNHSIMRGKSGNLEH